MTVITASPKGFQKLLDLQEKSLSTVNTIRELMENQRQDATVKVQQDSVDVQNKILIAQKDAIKQDRDQFEAMMKQRSDDLKKAAEIASGMKTFKSFGEKFKDFQKGFSDKFLGGNLGKTLMQGMNFGGIFNKKMEQEKFIQQQQTLGTEKSRKQLKRDFKEAQSASKDVKAADNQIDQLRKLFGNKLSDDQLRNTKKGAALFAAKDAATERYAKFDKTVGAAADKPAGLFGMSSLKKESATSQAAKKDDNKEAQVENANAMEAQTDLLTRIAEATEATAGDAVIKAKKKDEKTDDGGSIIDKIMDFIGNGFMKALRFIFSPKNLLKAITKVFAPAMIIGSLVSGIMDGFDAWKETGSIKEALIAGVGGVLKFLSFGLFDAQTVKDIANSVSAFVSDYIVKPVSNFVGAIGDMFSNYIAQPIKNAFDQIMNFAQYLGQLFTDYVSTPIANAFEPVKSFFAGMIDSVMSVLKSIQIPGVSIKIPLKDDPIQIGPWSPFGDDSSKKAPEAVTPQTGNTVLNGSRSNADAAAAADGKGGATNNVVNAPVTSSTTQNNISKPAVRNQESSQSRYLSSKYA